MKQHCEVFIGRLVSHPCAQQAASSCSQCGAAFCPQHASRQQPGLCAVCGGEHTPPKAPTRVTMDELYSFSRDEIDSFEQSPAPSLHDYDS